MCMYHQIAYMTPKIPAWSFINKASSKFDQTWYCGWSTSRGRNRSRLPTTVTPFLSHPFTQLFLRPRHREVVWASSGSTRTHPILLKYIFWRGPAIDGVLTIRLRGIIRLIDAIRFFFAASPSGRWGSAWCMNFIYRRLTVQWGFHSQRSQSY